MKLIYLCDVNNSTIDNNQVLIYSAQKQTNNKSYSTPTYIVVINISLCLLLFFGVLTLFCSFKDEYLICLLGLFIVGLFFWWFFYW